MNHPFSVIEESILPGTSLISSCTSLNLCRRLFIDSPDTTDIIIAITDKIIDDIVDANVNWSAKTLFSQFATEN